MTKPLFDPAWFYYDSKPAVLTMETLRTFWDAVKMREPEVTMDMALEELMGKAGVESSRRAKYLDSVNHYDQAEVDRCRKIVEANFARVWETREEGETERDLIERTMGELELDQPEPFAFLKAYMYGHSIIKPGGNVGKLTGLSNC